MQISAGDTVIAPDNSGTVRPWTVACEPYYEGEGSGLVVVDPHVTDDERSTIERADKASEGRRRAVLHGVTLARTVIEISDIVQ